MLYKVTTNYPYSDGRKSECYMKYTQLCEFLESHGVTETEGGSDVINNRTTVYYGDNGFQCTAVELDSIY